MRRSVPDSVDGCVLEVQAVIALIHVAARMARALRLQLAYLQRCLTRVSPHELGAQTLAVIALPRPGPLGEAMTRQEVLLAMLAAADGGAFQPVHVQKAMFLLSDRVPALFMRNSRYHFTPYDYGPFDSAVYEDLDALQRQRLVAIERDPGYRYRVYVPTNAGLARGRELLGRIREDRRALLHKIVKFVRSLDFRSLVSAIYEAYPDMKQNSAFREKAF